ncbi:MAG TPA: TonB-dependent receptor plug domain-containing protein [Chitinophagaceae bacterium]|nr:TonB-dependent receptor plug domain-containing protein [Chitinophagaceae bacterium]
MILATSHPHLCAGYAGTSRRRGCSRHKRYPGGAINVTIRGVGSLNAGNTPLYVVDGIQINTNLSGSIGGSSSSGSSDAVKTQNNPLAFLNPGDIESIEILKDAASPAIYGAKAGSGVVIVTTKKGTTGKTKFDAHLSYGSLEATKLHKPLNTQEWLQNRIEGIVNTSGFRITPDSARKTALGEIGQPVTLTDKEISELNSTDWMKAGWGRGQIRDIDMSMQAGNPITSLYMSGSYSYQTSHIKPTNFERGTFLIKASHKVSKKVILDASVNLSTFSQDANFGQGGGNNNTINTAYAATQILPINPIYRSDGSFYGLANSGDAWYGSFANNPVSAAELLKINVRTNQLIGGFSGTYNITSDISLKSMVGLDYRLAQVKAFHDARLIGGIYASVNGTGEAGSNWTTNFITTQWLLIKKA